MKEAFRHPLIAADLDVLVRHPIYTLTKPRSAWATRKAVKAYRKEHPVCEWDGKTTPVHVHHVVPIAVDPGRAADPENMISLGAKRNHLVVGHAGNWRRYVLNVKKVCRVRMFGRIR
jgi:hypothetical protein